MKQWMRLLAALFLAVCGVIVSNIVATPSARASSQNLWVNCQVYFQDGPRAGQTEPDSFLVSSGGGLTSYASDYVGGQSNPGSWFSNGPNTTGFTFSAPLVAVPGGDLTVNETFTNNTYPVVATGTGSVFNSSGQLLFTTHTQVTCPYFIPGTTGCQITYAMSQWTGAFTATITIGNTSSTSISSGGTLVFVFPGTQAVTQGWNGTFSQNGSTVTVSNLAAISANNSISIGFNGTWSGSNPNPVQYTLNGTPCSVNV